MRFYGENCEKSNLGVTFAWGFLTLASMSLLFFSLKALSQLDHNEMKRKINVSSGTCVFTSFASLNCCIWASSCIYRCINLPNQQVLEEFVIPISATLFGLSTLTGSLNVSVVWIELATRIMKWMTEEKMSKSRKMLILGGISYSLAVFLSMTVLHSYSYAAAVSGLAAIIISLVFMRGSILVARKLEVNTLPRRRRLDFLGPLKNKKTEMDASGMKNPQSVGFKSSHSHMGTAFWKVFPLTTGIKSSLKNMITTRSKVCPEGAKPTRTSAVRCVDFSRDQHLSKVSRKIMETARGISWNCFCYFLASLFYAIFSLAPRLGVIATISGVVLIIAALRVNYLVVKYLISSIGRFPIIPEGMV